VIRNKTKATVGRKREIEEQVEAVIKVHKTSNGCEVKTLKQNPTTASFNAAMKSTVVAQLKNPEKPHVKWNYCDVYTS